jgi:hypothetical protein
MKSPWLQLELLPFILLLLAVWLLVDQGLLLLLWLRVCKRAVLPGDFLCVFVDVLRKGGPGSLLQAHHSAVELRMGRVLQKHVQMQFQTMEDI